MKKTRLFSLAMVIAMLFTCSFAFAEPEENTLPICTDGSVQLKFYMAMESGSEQKMATYDEHPAILTLEERTGVDITFIHPPAGDDGTYFNTLVASMQYPDVWITTGFNDYYPGGVEGAIEDGILANTNDLINQYGYYYLQEAAKWDAAVTRNMKTDSGLWRLGAANQRVPVLGQQHSGLVMRKDWLEKYGLEVPTTVSEMTTVLQTLKDNGVEVPFAAQKYDSGFWSSGNMLSSAFGVFHYGFQLNDDYKTVTFSMLEPGYKDYINYLTSWMEAGLIDRDFVNRSEEDARKMVANGRSAMCWIGNWTTQELTALGKVEDPDFELIGISSLKPDDQPDFINEFGEPIVNGTSTQTWVISATSNHQKEAMKVLDYLYSPEGIDLMVFGPEEWDGEVIHTHNADGTRTFSDYMLHNPNLEYNTIRYQYTIQALSSEYSSDMEAQQYNAPINAQCWEAWTKDLNNKRRIPPTISLTAAESTTQVNTMNTIKTYILEKVTKIICGDDSIDNWDSYVEMLHTYGIDDVIAIQQAAFDRYQVR